MIEEIILSSLRLSIPLVLAAYGGLVSERSGVANIALEALLLFSAFFAAAITAITGQLWWGVVAGLLASTFVGACFATVCIWGRGDQIVIGTGFNLLAVGVIPVLSKGIFGLSGSTPALSKELTFDRPWIFFVCAIIVLCGLEYLFRQTRHGLRVIAAGENPAALVTQGVNYKLVRLRAVIEGSFIAGLGGVYLSLCQGSGYIRDMSAGRGFIALAALIFGAWRPLPTFIACLFFALADASQMLLQGQTVGGIYIPNQFIQILPFLVTLFVLLFYHRRISAPAALNRDIKI